MTSLMKRGMMLLFHRGLSIPTSSISEKRLKRISLIRSTSLASEEWDINLRAETIATQTYSKLNAALTLCRKIFVTILLKTYLQEVTS